MTRPGLVVVSPIPPAQTGIADYTARLLPELVKHWNVTVVVADDDPVPDEYRPDMAVVPYSAWRSVRRVVRADRILYALGNSRHHLHVPDMCQTHGGVVLAHDVRMTALHCLRAAVHPDPHALSTLVGTVHGLEVEREIRSIEDRAPVVESFAEVRRRLEDLNVFLLAPTVIGADLVAVHSHTAARLARLELSRRGCQPVSVVSFGLPPVSVSDRDPRSGLISSFGMVEPEKNPCLIIEALASVRRRIREAHLRLIGPVSTSLDYRLRGLARRLGVEDAFVCTGKVDDKQYREELAMASIAVQMKSRVNGESSAAVGDCLSEGVPVVVSAVGAQRELPADAVVHVPGDVRPHELADILHRILTDRPWQDRLSEGGRSFAQSNSPAKAVADLNALLESAPPPRDL